MALKTKLDVSNARRFGCAADDSTDDRAALLRTSNDGKQVEIPAGTYRVASDLTIAKHVVFLDGAILHPDDGVRVTLTNGYTAAPKQQVFDISSGGQCFASKPSNSTQYHWGAVDGTGSDSTAALQACIDQAIYFDGSHHVKFAAGHHASGPLVVGWGDNDTYYTGALVEGATNPYGTDTTAFGGTRIIYTTHENAIEVRSGRQVKIRKLFLRGPWYSHIQSNDLGGISSDEDPSVVANWVPSGAPAAATTRYAHSAGIHFDPRAGSEPATAYSDITIPNYADRGQGQYGHIAGALFEVEDCTIQGFGIGVAVKGCADDANADFPEIRTTWISECLVAMSVGNTQCRQALIQDGNINRCYSAFDTGRIGSQLGKPSLTMQNVNLDRNHQIFDVATASYGGAIVLNNCYAEVLGRLGNFTTNAASLRSTVTFVGGEYRFQHSAAHGYASALDSVIDVTNTNLIVDGSTFEMDSVMPFIIRGAPRNCIINANIQDADWDISDNVARALAVGSTCHVMFLADDQLGWRGQGYYSPAYVPSTGSANASQGGNRQNYGPLATTAYDTVIPFPALQAITNSTNSPHPVPVALGQSIGATSLSGKTIGYSGRELTIDLGSLSSSVGYRLNYGWAVGCLLFDTDQDNLFVITDVTGTEVTAVQLNDYALADGTPNNPTTTDSTVRAVPTGYYLPDHDLEYVWTSSSANVPAARSQGTALADAQVPAGSAIVSRTSGDARIPLGETSTGVSSISSGTITFEGNADASRTTYNHLFLMNRT